MKQEQRVNPNWLMVPGSSRGKILTEPDLGQRPSLDLEMNPAPLDRKLKKHFRKQASKQTKPRRENLIKASHVLHQWDTSATLPESERASAGLPVKG